MLLIGEFLEVIAEAMTPRTNALDLEAQETTTEAWRVKGWGDRLVVCMLHRRRRTVITGASPNP